MHSWKQTLENFFVHTTILFSQYHRIFLFSRCVSVYHPCPQKSEIEIYRTDISPSYSLSWLQEEIKKFNSFHFFHLQLVTGWISFFSAAVINKYENKLDIFEWYWSAIFLFYYKMCYVSLTQTHTIHASAACKKWRRIHFLFAVSGTVTMRQNSAAAADVNMMTWLNGTTFSSFPSLTFLFFWCFMDESCNKFKK